MASQFRKSLKLSPIRVNLSKSGVGYCVGERGFRVGKVAKDRSYTATSIPGTGLYNRTYSHQCNAIGGSVAPVPGAATRGSNGAGLALGNACVRCGHSGEGHSVGCLLYYWTLRWLLQREARFPYSSLKGVECPPNSDAVGSALFGMLAGTRIAAIELLSQPL